MPSVPTPMQGYNPGVLILPGYSCHKPTSPPCHVIPQVPSHAEPPSTFLVCDTLFSYIASKKARPTLNPNPNSTPLIATTTFLFPHPLLRHQPKLFQVFCFINYVNLPNPNPPPVRKKTKAKAGSTDNSCSVVPTSADAPSTTVKAVSTPQEAPPEANLVTGYEVLTTQAVQKLEEMHQLEQILEIPYEVWLGLESGLRIGFGYSSGDSWTQARAQPKRGVVLSGIHAHPSLNPKSSPKPHPLPRACMGLAWMETTAVTMRERRCRLGSAIVIVS